MSKPSDQIKYIQLEPDGFLSDVDFQMMTDAERGCYFTLILYLYRNGGSLVFDRGAMGTLCGSENFGTIWEKIKSKFIRKRNRIYHKRVTKELKIVRERMQVAVESGLKGAQVRWGAHSPPNREPVAKRNGTKPEPEGNIPVGSSNPSFSNSSGSRSASDELKFYDSVCKIFNVKSKSDQTSMRNVAKYLRELVNNGATTTFDECWDIAKECTKGNKPIALFISRMKTEMGYLRDAVK